MANKKYPITKKWLHQAYVVDKLPIAAIAASLGCDPALVGLYARKYRFPRRNQPPRKRVAGEKIGDWVLLSSFLKKNRTVWRCQCTLCGGVYDVHLASLNGGNSQSCWRCGVNKRIDRRIVPGDYFLKLRFGAVRRKISFALSRRYVEQLLIAQNHKCALSGLSIEFARGRPAKNQRKTTASLDRIDSARGYLKGNVQWVHKEVNNMKQALPETRFVELCAHVARKAGASVTHPAISTTGKDTGSIRRGAWHRKHRSSGAASRDP